MGARPSRGAWLRAVFLAVDNVFTANKKVDCRGRRKQNLARKSGGCLSMARKARWLSLGPNLLPARSKKKVPVKISIAKNMKRKLS